MRTHVRAIGAVLVAALAVQARAEVDESGAFNYAIPITLPEAVGDAQPEIALSYSSHDGNGPVGVGWDLEGFPVITRMSYGSGIKYDATDTYVGPYGMLRKVDGTQHVYRTEDETWGKYVAYRCTGAVWTGTEGDGGPCYWRLTKPDGAILEFAGTGLSRIQAIGREGAIRVWALSKYTDRHGNFYSVSYFEDTASGDYYPAVVTYNEGNGRSTSYTVEFGYEARPDHVWSYEQSAFVLEDHRLTRIAVRRAGTLLREYRLAYEQGPATNHSRLISVQEYGRDGVSARPAHRFTYAGGSNVNSRYRWASAQGDWISTNAGAGNSQWFGGDFNGDGKADIAKIWQHVGHMWADVHVSSGSQFELQRWADAQGGWMSTNTGLGGSQWFSGDFTGDGKTDLAKIWNDGGYINADVHYSVGTAFHYNRWATRDGGWISTNTSEGNSQWFTGDFNGDGKADLAKAWNEGGGISIDVHRSTGTGFVYNRWATGQGAWISTNTSAGNSQWFAGDFNGDGKADLAKIWNYSGYVLADVHVSMGTHFVLQRWANMQGGWISTNTEAGNSKWFTGDFNGDGKTDLAKAWNEGGGISIDIHLSTGIGFVYNRWATGQGAWISTNSSAGLSEWFADDFDGDGRTDIAKTWNEWGLIAVDVHRSRGTHFELLRVGSGPNNGHWIVTNTVDGNGTWMTGDFDGSGNGDIALVWNVNNAIYMDAHLSNHGQAPRDVLTKVTNPLGGEIIVTHAPATQVADAIRPDLSTCGGASGSVSGPLCGYALPAPIPLVTRLDTTDGRGNTYSKTFQYYNQRFLPGIPADAELLGFEQTSELDVALNRKVVTRYRQEKPYQGREAELATFAGPPGQPRLVIQERTLNAYEAVLRPEGTRSIRLSQSGETHYRGFQVTHQTQTQFRYDAFDNVTLQSDLNDVATSADDVHTAIVYINDTMLWRIGVVRALRKCVDTACTQRLQHAQLFYDGLPGGQVGQAGNVTYHAEWRSDTDSWPGSSMLYDAAGSLLGRWNPAGTRIEQNTYDPASGALTETADALGHVTRFAHDDLTGDLVAVTDANGNTTTYAYDVFGEQARSEAPHDGTTRSIVERSRRFNPNLEVFTLHTDGAPLVTTRHLDGLGRVFRVATTWDNGALLTQETHFDSAGREFKTCAPFVTIEDESSCTTQHFDWEDRVVRRDVPRSGGGFATTTFAYGGYRTVETDSAGRMTVSDYDPATLTRTLMQPGNLVTATRVDLLGRTVRVTDPAGNIANTTYNSLGWVLAKDDPVTGLTRLTYDVLGNPISQTDAAGQVSKMYYDAASRLVRTDRAPLDSTRPGPEDALFKYDFLASAGDIANARGRMVRTQDGSGVTLFAYDPAGRMSSSVQTVDGVQYAWMRGYDRLGNLAAVTYPDGSVVRYRYETGARHLSAITLDGQLVMSYAGYDERGRPTSIAYGDRVNEMSLAFESSTGELLQHQDSRGYLNNLYAYDDRGMLSFERDLRSAKPNGDTSKAFTYDELGQLATASGTGWARSYRYDNTGRVLEKDGKTFTYHANRPFQVARVGAEGTDRTYDPVGRLLSRESSAGADTYVHTPDGFLAEYRRNGALVQRMTYDYLGNRVKKEYLGTSAQTTWDLGSYKIVYDGNSGRYYHTVYIVGLHDSFVAHRTTQRGGLPAVASAGATAAYQDRVAASLFEPMSRGGLVPWASHHGTAMVKEILGDADGARGVGAAIVAFVIMMGLLGFALRSVWELASIARARLKGLPRTRRRYWWLAPAMLCLTTAACVENYHTQPSTEAATAESIAKDGRYSVVQAISRRGTNEPVPGTFYYLNSPLGSTSVMFDAQGAALLRLEYFPDGTVNTAASTGDYIATHTFGQKEYDKDLGAYYNAVRYYDPETMQFTTPDAIKESSDYLVHNLYAYTRNNPVNYVDPTGFLTMKHDGGGRVLRKSRWVRPPPKTYKPKWRPRNPQRTLRFNRGPDGKKPVRAVRAPTRQRTDRFNRGPDGGPRKPAVNIIRPSVPGRDHMPADNTRGYHMDPTLTDEDRRNNEKLRRVMELERDYGKINHEDAWPPEGWEYAALIAELAMAGWDVYHNVYPGGTTGRHATKPGGFFNDQWRNRTPYRPPFWMNPFPPGDGPRHALLSGPRHAKPPPMRLPVVHPQGPFFQTKPPGRFGGIGGISGLALLGLGGGGMHQHL